MPDGRRFELDELLNRPGTYFNPQTEVLVVVDDSPEMDAEIFNMEEFEGADWVLISDDIPVDEQRRDEMLETFQVRLHPDDLVEEEEEDELDELSRTSWRSSHPADRLFRQWFFERIRAGTSSSNVRGRIAMGVRPRPSRRVRELLCEEIGDELLVFDSESARAHSLNATAAKVWRSCNGGRDLEALATECQLDPETVALALERLRAAHLLEEDAPQLSVPALTQSGSVSRRTMLRRTLVAGTGLAVAAPVIRSITAPTPAMAITIHRKGRAGQHCSNNTSCSPVSHCQPGYNSCQRNPGASCSHTSSCAHGSVAAFVCTGGSCGACTNNSQCPGSHRLCQGGICY